MKVRRTSRVAHVRLERLVQGSPGRPEPVVGEASCGHSRDHQGGIDVERTGARHSGIGSMAEVEVRRPRGVVVGRVVDRTVRVDRGRIGDGDAPGRVERGRPPSCCCWRS